jgi:hypothetical protein
LHEKKSKITKFARQKFKNMKQDMIVILDLGSHENTVVARAIRALGVYSEIYPHDITAEELKALPNVKGVIINGGPNNVIDGVEIDVLPEIYGAGLPVMAAGHEKALCEVKLPQFANDEDAIKDAVREIVKKHADDIINRAVDAGGLYIGKKGLKKMIDEDVL